MKYFNYKFLKENLKQGKGILLFFLILLPFSNIVYLFISNLNKKYIISFSHLSLLTYLGMIIIPLVIAYVLFGFIFKKKNVDFYLSQPINRKSIYITNFIGGCFLILILLLVNVFIFKIFGVFTSISMPSGLLLDYFIYFFISYIFFYLLYILGFSLSGNLWTSLVVSILILCLIPFLRVINEYFLNLNKIYLVCSNGSINCSGNILQATRLITDHSFITPISFLFNGIYKTKDVILTIIISIIYLFLSYFIFMQRKMENNESSFKNTYIHFLVKTLTLIPLCFIIYISLTEESLDITLILIVLSLIYYILYDLITRRSIYKIGLTLFMFIVTIGISLGLFTGYSRFTNKDIIFNKVSEIKTDLYDIKDKEIINKIFQEAIKYSNGNYHNYGHTLATITNDNVKYSAIIPISYSIEESLQEYKLPLAFNYSDSDYASLYYEESFPITLAFRNLLKEYQENSNAYNVNYELYKYVNHDYQKINLYLNEDDALTEYTMQLLNKDFISEYKKEDSKYSYVYIMNDVNEVLEDNYEIIRYILNANKAKFIEYLEEHQTDKINKNYLKIIGYSRCYFISDIDGFKKLFAEFKKNVENDEGYKNIIKEYNEYYN